MERRRGVCWRLRLTLGGIKREIYSNEELSSWNELSRLKRLLLYRRVNDAQRHETGRLSVNSFDTQSISD